jgi:Lipocalin-like domain
MKKVVMLLACCWLTAGTSGSEPPSSVAKSFVGLWKLVRIEVRQPDGRITTDPDLGPHAAGHIFYDATGHMGVQLMNPDRPKWKSDDQPTHDEALASVAGFEAYSRTYEVHESEAYVVHHTELSLDPNGVGRDRKRKFELTGNQQADSPSVADNQWGDR